MKFIADFHIHSKYSRATSKNLDLENIYIAARQKGLSVVGTGDFTHPAWFAELTEKLEPAEPGLFKLKESITSVCDKGIQPSCGGTVRFILVSEISNIYKKRNKTRKNHNLVFLPSLTSAKNFNARLEAIGNIKSDGRPILGLDAKHLLEILLETDDTGFLVPAHIWTPWFSMLGSKSGFDSLEACFEDLTPYIFAAETGLSSDPDMNRRVSGLDRLTLISNSDAHSPSKLGREANIFNTENNYFAIKEALRSGDPEKFMGTYEFYPQEGKYHLDGHRKCGVRWWPGETRQHRGICPVCGKPVTRGVLNRVEELADRPENIIIERRHPFHTILPLTDILANILQVGPQSKKVQQAYTTTLEKMGPELDIINHLPVDRLRSDGIPLLGEAIQRMRAGKIQIKPGFDGEFGSLSIFSPGEREKLETQKRLFPMPITVETEAQCNYKGVNGALPPERSFKPLEPVSKKKSSITTIDQLNRDQLRAVNHQGTPLLIVAGPGTGKTLTLTHRIARMIKERGVAPETILAVTFTNKAAQEMSHRLNTLLPSSKTIPLVSTFHGFCVRVLKEVTNKNRSIIDDAAQTYMVGEAVRLVSKTDDPVIVSTTTVKRLIEAAKQQILGPDDDLSLIINPENYPVDVFREVYKRYQDLLSIQGVYDYEDLIINVVRLLEKGTQVRKQFQATYPHVFVDEYQDLNTGQYRIIKALAPPQASICVIGDPDQSIYGFRGSDAAYFKRFVDDYPAAEVVHLNRNYRSTETILEASHQIIRDQHTSVTGSRTYSDNEGEKTITIIDTASDRAEAVAVGKLIEQMIGGTGFHSIDFGRVDNDNAPALGFSDFAVLFRTHSQIAVFEDVFNKAGIPYQTVSKVQLYNRPGIKEIFSFLRVLTGGASYADLDVIIGSTGLGVGKKTTTVLKNWCIQNRLTVHEAVINTQRFPVAGLDSNRQLALSRALQSLQNIEAELKACSTREIIARLKDTIPVINKKIDQNPQTRAVFERMLTLADEYKDGVAGFLLATTLQVDTDQYEYDKECVSLITMHASKGLEFPVVFVAGCENGYIPYKRATDSGDLAEERRLFYVAMTRAKERLYLTHARSRAVFGCREKRLVSDFIDEIEVALRNHIYQDKKPITDSPNKQVQLTLF